MIVFERLKHRGHDNAISAKELSLMFGLPLEATQSSTRHLIRSIARERGLPLLANSFGYFIATDEAELREYNDSIMNRIGGIIRNQQMMNENFYTFNYRDAKISKKC